MDKEQLIKNVESAAKELLRELIDNIEGLEIEPKNYNKAVPNLRAYSIRIPENWFESAKKVLAIPPSPNPVKM